MRILVVHNFYQEPGGEDIAFAMESELLRSHGLEIIEHTVHNRTIGRTGVTRVAINAVWSWTSWRRVTNICRETRPDLVHFHNIFPLVSPSAYHACRALRIPIVQTLHNYRLGCPKGVHYRDGRACEDCLGKSVPWPALVHACYRNSRPGSAVVAAVDAVHRGIGTWRDAVDVYIALSEFARHKHLQAGYPAERIVIKPNFVSPDPGVTRARGDYALYVGRLSSEKGVRTLARAWQALNTVPLKVVGDGLLAEEIRTSLANRSNVEFLERRARPDVLELMRNARFIVVPSGGYENFPLAIAEAFACGTSVIGSRIGAVAEIVEHGRTGLLFKAGDSDELARQVTWAWSNPGRMEEMGRQARREYQLKYGPERNYEMLLDIYHQAIRRAQHRRTRFRRGAA
jgi:glycosyltransferase involved in cell wall biosynthesis